MCIYIYTHTYHHMYKHEYIHSYVCHSWYLHTRCRHAVFMIYLCMPACTSKVFADFEQENLSCGARRKARVTAFLPAKSSTMRRAFGAALPSCQQRGIQHPANRWQYGQHPLADLHTVTADRISTSTLSYSKVAYMIWLPCIPCTC